MDARAILEEVAAEARRQVAENGGKPLPPKEESELRKWEITRYTEAIRLDPALAEAYVKRGCAFRSERRCAEARDDMRKAFSLRPSEITLYLLMPGPFEGEEQREILRVGMGLADPSTWEYEHLRSYFIRTYWYDGNFNEHVRLLEEWVPQLDEAAFQYRHELQNLADAYSALGQHERAEATYRRALAVSPVGERRFVAEMVVRARMHRDQFAEAREALKELRSDLPVDRGDMLDAALLVLLDPASRETRTAADTVLAVAERMGTAPGPTGKSTSYSSFLLGLIYRGAGKHEAAADVLSRFASDSASNTREWAITLRWEIAVARRVAA